MVKVIGQNPQNRAEKDEYSINLGKSFARFVSCLVSDGVPTDDVVSNINGTLACFGHKGDITDRPPFDVAGWRE
jgi:hypothetical protein